METELVTTGQAGEILGLSTDSVRRLEREGTLSAIKVGKGHRLFERSHVEKLRTSRERAARRADGNRLARARVE